MTSGDSEVTQLHKVPVFGRARGGRSQCRGAKGHCRARRMDFSGKRLVGRAAPAGHGPLAGENSLRNTSSLSLVVLPSVVDYLKKCKLVDESETVIIPNFCINLCFPS